AQCDFEADACGWHEFSPGDGFDWVRSSPHIVSTDQQIKVPLRDHTTNTST
ncbi:MAM and LDL-receptor class A domain-containing protein 1, partial [Clarias magur]